MNLRINSNYLFANPLYRSNTMKRNSYTGKSIRFSSDEVSISSTGRSLSASSKHSFTDINHRVDKSIDLQKYVDEAKKINDKNIEKVGTKIFTGAVSYKDTTLAMRDALREKYSKLVAEAKTHENPKLYISLKYKHYVREGKLSKSEAAIGYRNEMSMLKKGDVDGVCFGDSLFRNAGLSGEVIRRDGVQYKRRVVNKQIENIFEEAGISKEKISKDLSFSVDPYNYKITVSGVDEITKNQMEKALNVGENGQYLYYHLKHTSGRDGTNSIQRTDDGELKYRAYHNVLDYTGLKLNELKSKDNTFYTNDNVDLKVLISKAVDNDPIIPKNVKEEYKQIQYNYITEIARRGWENIIDMPLKVLYGKNGLVDFGQDIIFDGYTQLLGKHWYSVI